MKGERIPHASSGNGEGEPMGQNGLFTGATVNAVTGTVLPTKPRPTGTLLRPIYQAPKARNFVV